MTKTKWSAVLFLVFPLVASSAYAQKGVSTPSKIPSISSISPTSATAGGAAFTLSVNGSTLSSGSVVQWNGSNRTTTYVSATQLQAQITIFDIGSAGTAQVAVYNPGKGGGTSNVVSFTINPAPTTSTSTTSTTSTPTTTTPTTTSATTLVPLSISPGSNSTITGGTVGSTYSQQLSCTGGTGSYTYTVSTGTLPPGISLASGVLSGTPSTAGTYSFTLQATDTANNTATATYSLTIASGTTTTTTTPTTYFQTGFEEGTFSGIWTGLNSYPPGPPTINTNPTFVHSGSYSAQFQYYICGDSTNPACMLSNYDTDMYLYKTLPTGLTHFFVRAYVYLKHPEPGGTVDGIQRKLIYLWVDPSTGGYYWSAILTTDSATGVVPARFVVQNTPVGGTTTSYWGVATLTYDAWYCIELEIQNDTATAPPWNGVVRLWVNGVKTWENTSIDLNRGTNYAIGTFLFGQQGFRPNYNVLNEYRYWDDIVISSSYVGP